MPKVSEKQLLLCTYKAKRRCNTKRGRTRKINVILVFQAHRKVMNAYKNKLIIKKKSKERVKGVLKSVVFKDSYGDCVAARFFECQK